MEQGTKNNQRERAERYDLLQAIDEAMTQDFAALDGRVEQLQKMLEAWMDVPAFQRTKWPLHSGTMACELDAARGKLSEVRHWNWTRRVAGYGAGKLFIGEA